MDQEWADTAGAPDDVLEAASREGEDDGLTEDEANEALDGQ